MLFFSPKDIVNIKCPPINNGFTSRHKVTREYESFILETKIIPIRDNLFKLSTTEFHNDRGDKFKIKNTSYFKKINNKHMHLKSYNNREIINEPAYIMCGEKPYKYEYRDVEGHTSRVRISCIGKAIIATKIGEIDTEVIKITTKNIFAHNNYYLIDKSTMTLYHSKKYGSVRTETTSEQHRPSGSNKSVSRSEIIEFT